jgi:hypothetical protein
LTLIHRSNWQDDGCCIAQFHEIRDLKNRGKDSNFDRGDVKE